MNRDARTSPHRRFYAPDCNTEDVVVLSRAEAHHLRDVRRLAVGDRVTLFDGAGLECEAEVRSSSREGIELFVVERRRMQRSPNVRVAIALPPVKGRRTDWAVQKCAELGVETMIPIVCTRSVVRNKGPSIVQRWHRIAVEAAKQSGATTLLQIEPLCAFSELERQVGRFDAGFIATREAPAAPLRERLSCIRGAASVLGVIGPEGGFTEKELVRADALGLRRVSLGKTILRTETAAVSLAAILCITLDA